MVTQILIGTIIIIMTITIQSIFISIAIGILTKYGTWFIKPPFIIKTTIGMICVVLWLIVGISLSVWSWVSVFMINDVFDNLESAFYFSTVTFTTLGYGDIVLNSEWRILGSIAGVNGLIIFGLNTAFLVEFTSRLRSTQENIINVKNKI